MTKIILILLLILMLRFVVRYVWPVVKVMRSANQTVRHMQDQMQQQGSRTQVPPQQGNYKSPKTQGDYIDFEEVK